MITRIGSSNPVHCTSVGKAILAFLPEERDRPRFCAAPRFERFTQRTIATPEALRAEIEKTRRRGYAVDDEELEEGLRCIAVPLLDAQRLPVAAVSVSGPSFRVTAQKLPSIANHLAAVRARHLAGHGVHLGGARQPRGLDGLRAADGVGRLCATMFGDPIGADQRAQHLRRGPRAAARKALDPCGARANAVRDRA